MRKMKGSCYGKQAFRLDVDKQYHCGNIFSKWVNLAYNTISNCKSFVG